MRYGIYFVLSKMPRQSEFNRLSRGPLQGAKMTVVDILEFNDMNGPDPMPKTGVMRANKVMGATPPPPFRLYGCNLEQGISIYF